MSAEHIWSDWIRELVPRQKQRVEGMSGRLDDNFNPLPDVSQVYEGDVGTKTADVVCERCNNGWMSQIVEAAKPYARPLILGEPILLDEAGQAAITSWVALSALMRDQVARSRHALTATDRDHFYNSKAPPAHWFVGLGTFSGDRVIAADHSFAAFTPVAKSGRQRQPIVHHAFGALIGNLFTIVHIPPSAKAEAFPVHLHPYAPHVFPIHPSFASPIPFPAPSQRRIPGPAFFFPGTPVYQITNQVTGSLHALLSADARARTK